MSGTIHEVAEDKHLEFKTYSSRTTGIKCGCGMLYVIVDLNQDGTIHKIRIPRNTKFNCSLMMRDALAKQATYQVRREPEQLIKDLKGNKAHACKEYHIGCKAYSCSDAVAQVVSKELGFDKVHE